MQSFILLGEGVRVLQNGPVLDQRLYFGSALELVLHAASRACNLAGLLRLRSASSSVGDEELDEVFFAVAVAASQAAWDHLLRVPFTVTNGTLHRFS